MYSRRSRFSAPVNRITRALERARAAGRELWDLTSSNPTTEGFVHAPEILAALCNPKALRYRVDPQGLPEARQAVAEHCFRQGQPVAPEDLVLTPSTSDAYSHVFKLFCDPGDHVLVPRPSYPLLEDLAGLDGVGLRGYPLRYDGRYHIDLPALRGLVGQRTRAIIVVSPNNPTGSFVKQDELRGLAALGLPLIADEVFAPYPLDDDLDRATSLRELTDVPVLTFHGLSKSAALPQFKAAWIALGGAFGPRREIRHRLACIADSYLSTSIPVQYALHTLLGAAGPMQDRILDRVRNNFQYLKEHLANSVITVRHVEGGWYATLQVPRTRTEEAWVLALLDRADVLVQPGYFYDFEEEGMLVLSLLPRSATFRQGVARLLQAVERLL